MSRDHCRLPGCSRDPGTADHQDYYNDSKFCSQQCETKFEHLRADARDAERADRKRRTDERNPGERGQFR